MTIHIEAEKGDIADTVLLPGDPERAEWMAKTFLQAPRCINRRRGALGFTGEFRGKPVSIQTTGIGVSSFLIYAHELLDYYGVRTLIRTGTCGGLTAAVKLRSLVIARSARPESEKSGKVFGLYDAASGPDPALFARALTKASELGIDHHAGLIASSDIFHHPEGHARFADARAAGALAVDMETSALYRIAGHFGARALSICTVVDNIDTGEFTDYSERQTLFTPMACLALEVTVDQP
ncbi:DeoD-type purine-nucleoside phosphorylase [Mesorhizobium sp. ES1-1]|uniref:purine-nucleoside phosphorylase n=1 Tax=Mesorhizobium sp. ES1-1 TaxID=2876629 RepID=UPI001CCA48F5|nr:DeoD-type purine-nucleoside phosphorylase [Mesorhizobium sp. ES1-1]MBZ9677087.1 DeoD-type purine-nucleoside phosphorylase [Mesorhizobium sp. ES1-1]